MKLFVLFTFCALQVLNTAAKIIPDYLPQPCSRSQQDFSECTSNVLQKLGPYLLQGVPELNIPKMDPLLIPRFAINRTLEGILSYSLVLKNVLYRGFDTTQLKSFKFDTENMNGEVNLNVGFLRSSAEYEASGRPLRYPFFMEVTGYAKGNITNLDVFIKFSLKKIKNQGQTYYAFKNFEATGTVENSYINIISKSWEDQPIVDHMADFFNKNPKRGLAIIQDDFDDALGRYSKYLAEQVLNRVPAQELIPE